MKVIRLSDAESYEPEKDWKHASLCNEADISIQNEFLLEKSFAQNV